MPARSGGSQARRHDADAAAERVADQRIAIDACLTEGGADHGRALAQDPPGRGGAFDHRTAVTRWIDCNGAAEGGEEQGDRASILSPSSEPWQECNGLVRPPSRRRDSVRLREARRCLYVGARQLRP